MAGDIIKDLHVNKAVLYVVAVLLFYDEHIISFVVGIELIIDIGVFEERFEYVLYIVKIESVVVRDLKWTETKNILFFEVTDSCL
jgi:hypothetical protein